MQCIFLIVSLPENGIPEHQEINLIVGQHRPYFNVSHPKTSLREN